MRAKFSAFVAILSAFALTACGPTPAPHTGDDPTALDLRFHLFLTDEDGLSVDDFGLAEATLTGVAAPDPDTNEARHVTWIDYRHPNPAEPDGWMHWTDTMPFEMEVPGFEIQRIHPNQTVAVSFTATVDLFMGWTFSCAISDAKSGTVISPPIEGTPSMVRNPLITEGGDIEPFIVATVTCLWP